MTLVLLTDLVLILNAFEFNGDYFDQYNGVAIDTNMGSCCAYLLMGLLEHQVWQSHGGKSEMYGSGRYIDDSLRVTHMSLEELN